jgi:hypothetical protein
MSSILKANRGLSLALVSMTVISVAAVAQSTGSPFASKKKKQAWETDSARPSPSAPAYQAPTYQTPSYQAPSAMSPNAAPQYVPPPNYTSPQSVVPDAVASEPTSSYTSQNYSVPSYSSPPSYTAPTTRAATQPSYSAPVQSAQSGPAPQNYGTYQPKKTQNSSNGVVPPDLLPGFRRQAAGAGAYYPGRENPTGFTVPARAPRGQLAQNYRQPQTPSYNNQIGYRAPQAQSGPPQSYPSAGYKPSWKDRFGLGNLVTTFSAVLKVGAAAVQRKNTTDDTGWGAGFIADGKISGEVSAITRGGLEYGVGGEVRGQYDKYRRGFGGKVGDCGVGDITGVAGCNSLTVDGVVSPLRGHSSQFYSAGVDNAKASEFAVEGAYLFLRSAYGDVTVGRDDGAAYLFSLGAPTLLAVNASNSPVDYTGLDSVRTVNEASGFAEKIAYVSPRLLGDQIGLGVQFGASYAPNARACGVDYCVRSNGRDGSGALSPDLKNVVELGVALDRTFANGLSLEGTVTYATASEDSGLISTSGAGFDDLKSYGLGLEAKYGPWTLGGSFLNSNNGLINGDYEAYDIGLTFKPAQWGVSASYGHATDKNVNLLSDQATLGFVYDFERFTLGTGVQYIERDVIGVIDGLAAPRREKATALFIEGGVKF